MASSMASWASASRAATSSRVSAAWMASRAAARTAAAASFCSALQPGGVHQRQLNESLALGGGQGGLLRLLPGFLGGLPLFLGLLGCLLGIRQELHHLRLDLDDLVVGFCHLLGVFRSQGSGGGSLQIGVFSGLPGPSRLPSAPLPQRLGLPQRLPLPPWLPGRPSGRLPCPRLWSPRLPPPSSGPLPPSPGPPWLPGRPPRRAVWAAWAFTIA